MSKRDQIQKDALEVALRHNRCGLGISMGVGKTYIGLQYINHFQRQNMGKLRVLVVAPKLSIFDTWTADAEKFKIDIEDVEFCTYLSLNKQNPHLYDIVVLDECHSLLYNHETFLSNYKGRILGLTGTPPRYDKSEKGEMVFKYCPIMYNYITDDAIQDDILNDYKIVVHLLSLSTKQDVPVKTKNGMFFTSEFRNYSYWTERIMSATSKKQEQIASVMRMRAIMDYKTKETYTKKLISIIDSAPNTKCIIFCNTQDQADRMCKDSYHSGNEESEDNLERFKSGRITKLSCVLQLNEGVNIPGLNTGIILHSYGNERKSNQRIGRLLRLNPDETATIHVLCYKDTVDLKWVREALKDLDDSKIKYIDNDATSEWKI